MEAYDPQPRVRTALHGSFAGYFQMARIDHWVKNVFVLPGFLVALSVDPGRFRLLNPVNLAVGLLAVCLITSSNYVLNEILDARSIVFIRINRTGQRLPDE